MANAPPYPKGVHLYQNRPPLPCEAESCFELFYRKAAPFCSVTVAMTGFSEKVAYGIFLKIRKSCKKIFIQLRFLDTGFLTSLCLFLPIKFLKSYRRLVCQRLMGPLFVIEAHILVHTFSKICLRGVVPSIRFFPLKRSKECLGHCVVTGTARAGEGLLDAALLKQLKKGVRGILSSTVTVKSQICGVTPRSERIFECSCHQMSAAFAGNSVSHCPS